MRYEQIIAAVTRTLVIRTVREIEAVRSFVRNVDFQLSNLRMHLGMSALAAHARSRFWSSFDGTSGGINTGMTFTQMLGSKRGNFQYQPVLVPASCPASCPARLNRA